MNALRRSHQRLGRRSWALPGLLGIAACASGLQPAVPTPASSPPPAPPAAAPVSAPVAAPPRVNRYVFPRSTGEQRYRLEATARLERDSAGRREQVELTTTARVALDLQHEADRTRGSGRIEDFVVRGGERIQGRFAPTGAPAPLSLVFDLEIDSMQARVVTRPPLANECDRPETAATALVREMLVRLPRELAVGDQWRDSTVTFVCRNAVPITIRARNTYRFDRIENRDGNTILVITRATETQLQGVGGGAWRSLGLSGNGTGAQTLRVSAVTGALVELEGSSKLTMLVSTGASRDASRQQRITQDATLIVRRE